MRSTRLLAGLQQTKPRGRRRPGNAHDTEDTSSHTPVAKDVSSDIRALARELIRIAGWVLVENHELGVLTRELIDAQVDASPFARGKQEDS